MIEADAYISLYPLASKEAKALIREFYDTLKNFFTEDSEYADNVQQFAEDYNAACSILRESHQLNQIKRKGH